MWYEKPFTLTVILTSFLITVVFYRFLLLSPNLQDGALNHKPQHQYSKAPRTILLWNSFFANEDWMGKRGDKSPKFLRDHLRCSTYDCEVTSNRSFLSEVLMYDAVLFHAARPFALDKAVPVLRSPHQLYVFALMESPLATKHSMEKENYFYNLTMTYRLDSDINWSYAYVADIETGEVIAPNTNPKWRSPPLIFNDSTLWKLWPEKTKTVAWFVSNCNTSSNREKLVEELQKYIDVDIFGDCGTKRCERFSVSCDRMLDANYKFYLSFENALCTDYVTEKLYNAMKRFVVPIVFGGADYTRFAPPQSYINVEDFPDVKALAEHIIFLEEHIEIYMRYFWWRQYYNVVSKSPFCDICEKLHGLTFQHKMQTYRNIKQWWTDGSCRLKAKISF